jgi:hypothetical protein
MSEAQGAPRTRTRSRPSRRAVAVVVALDLAIATGVGVGVYLATRRFGAPTPPRNVVADTAVCVPEECARIRSSVSLSWTRPLAGGEVGTYVVLRGGEEVGRLGPGTTTFDDREVEIGGRYEYEVFAIGDEGRGRPSPAVSVRVPAPSIEHARLSGFYDVRLVFRQIDLLTRFEGVPDPAVGDSTLQDWQVESVCGTFQGACDVRVLGGMLTRDGRRYSGPVPTRATCQNERVESTQTVTLLVTAARVVGGVLYATAFTGRSEVDFRCQGEKVHAVAIMSGRLE